MIDEHAIPAFTDSFQFRVVGDNGLLVLIDGDEDFNARGIPEAFLLKVDGETTMAAILTAIEKDLAEPPEIIRHSVDELIARLQSKGAILFR